MACGKARAWRSMLVAQSALVWMFAGDDLDGEALEFFIATGNLGGDATEVMPYNPAILQNLQDSDFFANG